MFKPIPHSPGLATALLALTLSGCGPSDTELALQAERDALRGQLQAARQGLTAARQEANASRDQLHQLDVRVANLGGDNLLLTRHLADAQARLAETARQLADTQARADRLAAALEAEQARSRGRPAPPKCDLTPAPAADPPGETTPQDAPRPMPEAPSTLDRQAGEPGSESGARQQEGDHDTSEPILRLTQERNTLRERVGEIGAYARTKDDEIARLNDRLHTLEQQLTQAEARIQTLTFAHNGNKALLRDLYQRLNLTGQGRDLAMEAARAFAQRNAEQLEELRQVKGDARDGHAASPLGGPQAEDPGVPYPQAHRIQVEHEPLRLIGGKARKTDGIHPAAAQQ